MSNKFFGLILSLVGVIFMPLIAEASFTYFQGEVRSKLSSQSFLSDEIFSEGFTGLIYEFDVNMSPDDLIEGYVRLNDENGWGEWIMLTENNDHRSHHSDVYDSFENIVNSNLSNGFQFRFNIRSGGDAVLPSVKLKSYETINVSSEELGVIDSVREVASLRDIDDKFSIISREAWGADDTLNYTDEYEEEDWEAIEEFKENEYISRVITEKNGNLLKWPLQYTNDVKFLAVHHTATTADLDNPRQAIRNIQYFHAVRRGWGDIGYNYIVDRQGNIYEGRDGGKDIIGGHSREINKVSVGITLLGNYQDEDVPEAAMESLAKLLHSLADDYDLDVNGYDVYESKRYPVLGGHSDYSATSCPGVYGKSFLPILRNMIRKADENLDYEIESIGSLTANVKNGFLTSSSLRPEIRNLSGKTWNSSNTYLRVNSPNSDVVGSSQAKFNLISDTRSGSVAEFNGTVFGKAEAGLYELDADLYVNGVKVDDGDIKLGAYIEPIIVEVEDDNDDVPEGDEEDAPTIGNPFYAYFVTRNNKNTSSSNNSTEAKVEDTKSVALSVSNNSAVKLKDPNIRINISGFDLNSTNLRSSTKSKIIVDGRIVESELAANTEVIIWGTSSDGKMNIGYGDDNRWKGDVVRLEPNGNIDEGVIEVVDYEKRPSWNQNINDNKFRGAVEFRQDKGDVILINELGIESYLLGLAEVPDSEPLEKAKTIVVAARSYAYYYSNGDGKGLKYKGKPYHLNDSPESSQKYLGYGFEERSSMNKRAVLATEGETITWFGYDVVIPYFSESDGRTRTATEVWGWSRFKSPYLTSVDDSYCKGGNGTLWGHGVGISGCGATGMANAGFSYDEIINYYLKGIEIVKTY